MDGRLFLGTARFLQSERTDEAAYRSAVSRAYYACFITARNKAFATCQPQARTIAGIGNERDIRHQSLQQYLKSSPTETVRRLGEDLASLHGIRQDADYDMSKTISSADAKDAIDQAEAFLNELSETPPQEIGRAVEGHIRKTHKGFD